MNNNPEMTVYVTRYALKQGILKVSAVIDRWGNAHIRPTFAQEFVTGDNLETSPFTVTPIYRRHEWEADLSSAKLRAEKMRDRKLKALESSIRKLKRCKFDAVDWSGRTPFSSPYDTVTDETYEAKLSQLQHATNKP